MPFCKSVVNHPEFCTFDNRKTEVKTNLSILPCIFYMFTYRHHFSDVRFCFLFFFLPSPCLFIFFPSSMVLRANKRKSKIINVRSRGLCLVFLLLLLLISFRFYLLHCIIYRNMNDQTFRFHSIFCAVCVEYRGRGYTFCVL